MSTNLLSKNSIFANKCAFFKKIKPNETNESESQKEEEIDSIERDSNDDEVELEENKTCELRIEDGLEKASKFKAKTIDSKKLEKLFLLANKKPNLKIKNEKKVKSAELNGETEAETAPNKTLFKNSFVRNICNLIENKINSNESHSNRTASRTSLEAIKKIPKQSDEKEDRLKESLVIRLDEEKSQKIKKTDQQLLNNCENVLFQPVSSSDETSEEEDEEELSFKSRQKIFDPYSKNNNNSKNKEKESNSKGKESSSKKTDSKEKKEDEKEKSKSKEKENKKEKEKAKKAEDAKKKDSKKKSSKNSKEEEEELDLDELNNAENLAIRRDSDRDDLSEQEIRESILQEEQDPNEIGLNFDINHAIKNKNDEAFGERKNAQVETAKNSNGYVLQYIYNFLNATTPENKNLWLSIIETTGDSVIQLLTLKDEENKNIWLSWLRDQCYRLDQLSQDLVNDIETKIVNNC